MICRYGTLLTEIYIVVRKITIYIADGYIDLLLKSTISLVYRYVAMMGRYGTLLTEIYIVVRKIITR